MRGLQRLLPGLLGVSGEELEQMYVTQHSRRCWRSWKEKSPNGFLSIIQWLEIPGSLTGARGKPWQRLFLH